jgi:hypothetical protein
MTDESSIPRNIDEWIALFRNGTAHLNALAAKTQICWYPDETNPRRLHNLYARNLFTCYVAKLSDLCSSILTAIDQDNYLTYALCGRALIENAAVLRYFIVNKYQPLFGRGGVDMKKLIEIDDQHLRGSRFDWEAFFKGDYSRLMAVAAEKSGGDRQVPLGKNTAGKPANGTPSVIRIGECIRDWAAASPATGVLYDLFCDMVHPNIGSSFLVASASSQGGLYFSKHKGTSIGRRIFEQSFPLLVSGTQKPFGEYLSILLRTIWDEDEVGR